MMSCLCIPVKAAGWTLVVMTSLSFILSLAIHTMTLIREGRLIKAAWQTLGMSLFLYYIFRNKLRNRTGRTEQ